MNFALAHSSCGKIFRSLRSEVQQPSGCLFNLPVPELTRGAGIQLNERVSLRREAVAEVVQDWSTPHILAVPRHRGSLLFDWRQRLRPMRAGSAKGIQGVSNQNAEARYNYHRCDCLKHKRLP